MAWAPGQPGSDATSVAWALQTTWVAHAFPQKLSAAQSQEPQQCVTWKRQPTALEKSSSAESPTPTPPGFISTKTCPPQPLFSRLCPAGLGAGAQFPPALGINGRAKAIPGVSAPSTQNQQPLLQTLSGELLSGSEAVQLRGSPSSPYPATSRVPSRLAEPQELLYWEMPAAGTADTVFSLVSYPGAIAQLCFHKHTLKSTSLRTAKEGTAVGASFERVPLWAAGDGGKSLIGGPQGGCRVPRVLPTPSATSHSHQSLLSGLALQTRTPPPSGTGSVRLFQHPQQGHGCCPHSAASRCPPMGNFGEERADE